MDDCRLSEWITAVCDVETAAVEAQHPTEHRFSERFYRNLRKALEREPRSGLRACVRFAAVFALVVSLTVGICFLTARLGRLGEAETYADTASADDTQAAMVRAADVEDIPDGYQLRISEEADAVTFTFLNGDVTIRVEQRLDHTSWSDTFRRLQADEEKGRMIPMQEGCGYQNLDAENFELWWMSGGYAFRLETAGSVEDAMTVANGIRMRE